jgi:ribosomal protein S18 acetylase RimI-like enzyme
MLRTLTSLSIEQIDELKDQILDTYRQAFAPPPYNKTEADVISFSHTLELHRNRLNARFIAAQDQNNRVVGFAYGYDAVAGQWWFDIVERSMKASMAKEWLHGSFELVELAVKPAMQGQGMGSRLHDSILTGLSNRTAVLSTINEETAALHLYLKRGWVPLLERFNFPTSIHQYTIMGLKLPLSKEKSDTDR